MEFKDYQDMLGVVMKKQRLWVASGLFVLFSSLLALPSHAVMFRMLDAPQLGKAANTNGSMAFKGKVTKIEQVADGQAITFQIQDALKGKIKTGDTVTLTFPDPKFNRNLRLADGFPPPQRLGVSSEGVFFTTTRALDNKSFLIGGLQGQFFIAQQGGHSVVYNSIGNANLFSSQQMANPFMKKVVQKMREDNSGAVNYEDFKKLINQ